MPQLLPPPSASAYLGLNTRRASWSLNGRPAEEHLRENWERLRPAVYERVGLTASDDATHGELER